MLARKLRAAKAASTPSNGWDLANAVYQGSPLNYFSIKSTETVPSGVFFKPDGLKMYVIGQQNDRVYEYNLSTAWDIATASYLQDFYFGTLELTPQDIFFKPDGLKMYVIGSNSDSIYEYNLSTAWDISTASHLQTFSVAVQDTTPTSVFFKPDGLKMYVMGSAGDDVNEYNLSTAWDISTASYSQIFYVGYQDGAPAGLFFKPDGLRLYMVGSISAFIYQYHLSTAWNIATASYLYPTTEYLFVGTYEINPSALFFKPDGLKMYVLGYSGDDVNEYNLSTAWDISTASYLQNFSVGAQDTNPHGLFFKPDGLKMYVLGDSGNDVNEYNLSTAWDVSTASYLQIFSVALQETSPQGIFFKPDGLKMYVLGYSKDAVNEYNLSTAWDISTASYLQNFSVYSQDTAPTDLFFKPDGLRMYVTGIANDSVYEYNLSTAWDVSTASYLQTFSVAVQETGPNGLFFKPDGLKMYVTGNVTDAIWSYDFV